MIVLTSGKDASIAYCLTTALYCPIPGQYLAIARHKTIRRERKSPLSFLLFTLHQIAWNPVKHWGFERWRVAHHSSPLFTTLHLDILFIGLRWVNRAFLFHGLRTDFKRKIDLFGFWRKSHRFGFPFGRRFSIHRFSQIFRVKSGEEWWRVARNSSPVQIP